MEKNPLERYATAQELADDLRRFLEDKPIRAKRPTLLQRVAKWMRRHPAVVWSTAIITLILVASLGWILRDWQVRRTEAEARVVEALEVAEPKLQQGNPRDPELVSAARKAEAQLTGGVVRTGLRQRVEQLLADRAPAAGGAVAGGLADAGEVGRHPLAGQHRHERGKNRYRAAGSRLCASLPGVRA